MQKPVRHWEDMAWRVWQRLCQRNKRQCTRCYPGAVSSVKMLSWHFEHIGSISLDFRDRSLKLPFDWNPCESYYFQSCIKKTFVALIKNASQKHSSVICLTQVILAQIRVRRNEVQSLEKKTDKKRAIMIECQFHHAESNVRYISKFNPASLACRFSLLCVNIKLLLTFFFARWFGRCHVMSFFFFFFFWMFGQEFSIFWRQKS